MQLQIALNTIQCMIALDNSTKSLAFHRPDNLSPFVDDRGDITAIWGKGAVNINDVEYKYQVWHAVEASATLKAYFKSVIEADHFNKQQSIFGGF